MIINLLLKQTNKLAFINNLININSTNNNDVECNNNCGLTSTSTSNSQTSFVNLSIMSFLQLSTQTSILNLNLTKTQIEFYNQEINQIQRKIDETMYLKQGIDKRAFNVKEFLKK